MQGIATSSILINSLDHRWINGVDLRNAYEAAESEWALEWAGRPRGWVGWPTFMVVGPSPLAVGPWLYLELPFAVFMS